MRKTELFGCLGFLFFLFSFQVYGQQVGSSINNRLSQVNYDSLKVVLEDIYDRDQRIRKMIYDSSRTNPLENSKCISQMILIDQENLGLLIPIIDKYGWIPRSKIGEKANDAIFYVIQHSTKDLMAKYFSQLDSLAKIGEASKVHAAMMEDRLLMWKGQRQKYGSQATTEVRIDNTLVIWPIDNPDKVDSLRKACGFELTVFENAQRLGAIYNPDEKLPKKH